MFEGLRIRISKVLEFGSKAEGSEYLFLIFI